LTHSLPSKRPSAHVGEPTVAVANPLMTKFRSSPFKLPFKRCLITGCMQSTHFGLDRKQRQTSFLSEPVAIFNFNQVVGVWERHADNVAQKWRI
jgi:hypothetical protein